MPITTILLDLDDTIVDENPGRRVAREMTVKAIVGRHGYLDGEVVGRMADEISTWFWADAERHRVGRLDMPAARRDILGRVLERAGVPDAGFAAEIVERYQSLRDEALVYFEGAMEALEVLRGRYGKMGMITNGAGAAQRVKIKRFGLEWFFDHIQVEGELGRGKPDLGAFRHALEVLGAEAGEAVMVGNDHGADILPALEVGMWAVHICGESKMGHERYRQVKGIAEVPELLEDLF